MVRDDYNRETRDRTVRDRSEEFKEQPVRLISNIKVQFKLYLIRV